SGCRSTDGLTPPMQRDGRRGGARHADGSILAEEVFEALQEGAAMKHIVLAGLLISALGLSALPTFAQEGPNGTVLGSVTLSRKVLADGQPLAAGTYQVRLSSEQVKLVVGQTPDAERYVEFVRAGKVVGREVATVIPNSDLSRMKYGRPPVNSSKIETLKGADYLRVWINKSGNNYLI